MQRFYLFSVHRTTPNAKAFLFSTAVLARDFHHATQRAELRAVELTFGVLDSSELRCSDFDELWRVDQVPDSQLNKLSPGDREQVLAVRGLQLIREQPERCEVLADRIVSRVSPLFTQLQIDLSAGLAELGELVSGKGKK